MIGSSFFSSKYYCGAGEMAIEWDASIHHWEKLGEKTGKGKEKEWKLHRP